MSRRCRKSSRRQPGSRDRHISTPGRGCLLRRADAVLNRPLIARGNSPVWPMNILLLGSGGREHALAWKIAGSPLVTKLWCAPGNAGIAREAECVGLDIADHRAVIDFCRANAVDFVVVGPETPLAAGIVDDLTSAGIKAFGPGKQAARLEGSKGFTKDLCREFSIPTGAYLRFDNAEAALAYVRAQGAPIVVKADGLAAGKGVVVAKTLTEAEQAIAMMFAGGFGDAGAEVVIEEYLA